MQVILKIQHECSLDHKSTMKAEEFILERYNETIKENILADIQISALNKKSFYKSINNAIDCKFGYQFTQSGIFKILTEMFEQGFLFYDFIVKQNRNRQLLIIHTLPNVECCIDFDYDTIYISKNQYSISEGMKVLKSITLNYNNLKSNYNQQFIWKRIKSPNDPRRNIWSSTLIVTKKSIQQD